MIGFADALPTIQHDSARIVENHFTLVYPTRLHPSRLEADASHSLTHPPPDFRSNSPLDINQEQQNSEIGQQFKPYQSAQKAYFAIDQTADG